MKIDGLPVVDASKRLPFTITSRDVSNGDKKTPGSCPAAVALVCRTQATSARVHLTRTYLKIKNKWIRYLTPGTLRDEIISFDRGHRFEQGTYVLIPLPATQKSGQRAERDNYASPNNGNGKPRTKPHHVQGVRGSAQQYGPRG